MGHSVHVSRVQLIQALEKIGFRVLNRTDKHFVLTDGDRYFAIPKVNQIHSLVLNGILRDLNMTIEQFKPLL